MEQDSYLSSGIHVASVAHRRPRNADASMNMSPYRYVVQTVPVDGSTSVSYFVCYRAFLSVFGITNRRVQTLKASLVKTGNSSKDGRGKHAETEETHQHIRNAL